MTGRYNFRNSTAVVTGAGSGIGEACARGLADAGALVVGIDIEGMRLKPLADHYGIRFHAIALDLRDGAAVRSKLGNLPAPFDKPNILVNSAGLCFNGEAAHELAYELWESTVDVNIKGLMAATKALLDGMVARNRGHMVNIGSVAGCHAFPGANVYGATKAFVKMFCANLRADLVGTRVRVTEIAPGATTTNLGLARAGGDVEKMRARTADWPRLEAADVAEAVLWALSQPEQVQVNVMELTPLGMAPGPMQRQTPA